ncbi:MAG: phosphoglycerate kinase [bacterium]
MKLKSIKEIKKLAGKRVLLRVDFNISLGANNRVDKREDNRLRQSLPTIRYLLKKQARVILIAHLGRPNGRAVPALSLKPVVSYFEKLLGRAVPLAPGCLDAKTKKMVEAMKPGGIMMLENVRFNKGEEANDKKFAQALARYADVYINDAFAVSHRAQASISGITKYLPSYAGLLMQSEVETLGRVLKNPQHPLVVIIGGNKIETKAGVIKNLLPKADYILLAGTIANTVLKAQGVQVGKSIVDQATARQLKHLKLTDTKFKLPVDVILAKKADPTAKARLAAVANIGKNEIILDIGPETLKIFKAVIKKAKMTVWNGPMGWFEIRQFSQGTKGLAEAVAQAKGESIIGGGSTVEAVKKYHLESKMDFVSTGGGAMLEFLEGKMLPGVKPLIKS